MPKKRYYDEAMSKRDGGMIGGGTGQANMPQNVIMKNYPKDGSYMPENLNDGLSGIDSQISSDKSGAKKNLSKTKY
jgi:hypothetical protein